MLHEIARAFDQVWWHAEAWAGIDDTGGPQYGFLSGLGSDFGEIALVGGLWHLLHQFNCHEPRCWRIGPHQYDLDGRLVKLCKKHHPAIVPLAKGQVQAHHDAQAGT